MNTAMLGLLAETPVHPGAGSGMGVVDLPVAREAFDGLSGARRIEPERRVAGQGRGGCRGRSHRGGCRAGPLRLAGARGRSAGIRWPVAAAAGAQPAAGSRAGTFSNATVAISAGPSWSRGRISQTQMS